MLPAHHQQQSLMILGCIHLLANDNTLVAQETQLWTCADPAGLHQQMQPVRSTLESSRCLSNTQHI